MQCQRNGCTNEITTRKKYCSKRCSQLSNRERNKERENKEVRQSILTQKRHKKTAKRECLTCGKTFLSQGPWNRRCEQCQEIEDRGVFCPRRMHTVATRDEE